MDIFGPTYSGSKSQSTIGQLELSQFFTQQ